MISGATSSSSTALDCCPYCRANARVRAADLPPLHCYFADHFYMSTVLNDSFPSQESEELFGIRMGTDLGSLVFSCWQRLLCMGSVLMAGSHPQPYVCPAAVAAALAAGTLPALFERATRGCAALTRGQFGALQSMLDRGFADLPWDAIVLRNLATAECAGVAAPPAKSWAFSDVAPGQGAAGIDMGGGLQLFGLPNH